MVWWAVILLAVFLIGVTKSGFGAGVGLMIVPMTTIAMGHTPRGSEAAPGFMLPLLISGDLLAVWQYRRMFLPKALIHAPPEPAISADAYPTTSIGSSTTAVATLAPPKAPPREALDVLRRLLPGSIVGLVIGGALLWKLHHSGAELVSALIQIEIGLESIGLVGLHWWRQYRGVQTRLMAEPLRSHLTGGFSAISSTLAHAAGPIVAMYLLPLRLERQIFVGTCALYFFFLNTGKLLTYSSADMFTHANPLFSLHFLPVVLAGAIFGLWLNQRLSDKVFTKFVYIITFCLGWYVLAEGLMILVHRSRV